MARSLRRSPTRLRVSAALLLIAVALAPVGCGYDRREEVTPPATVPGDATGSLEASETTQVQGAITTSEAAALDEELEAIDKELDALTLPSDSDFSDIEDLLQ